MPNSYIAVPNVLPGNVTVGGNLTVAGDTLRVGSSTSYLRLQRTAATSAELNCNFDALGAGRDTAAASFRLQLNATAQGNAHLLRYNGAASQQDEGLLSTVFTDYTNHQNTGNTTENTIYSKTLRANLIGANGGLRIKVRFLASADAGAGTLVRLKLGGTTLNTQSVPAISQFDYEWILVNRNSVSSQFLATRTLRDTGAVTVTQAAFAINTGADQVLSITSQSGNAADVQNFDMITVELLNTFGPVT